MPEFVSYLEPVIILSGKAGEEILDVYNREQEVSVSAKDDNSPLTEADMRSHHRIKKALEELTPDLPVLSEESADIPYTVRKSWSTYWLVDPLDGTREFIKHNGEFTVNIALIHDHLPVLGVVHIPVQQTTYYACRHQGVFKQKKGDSPRAIHTRKTDLQHLAVAGSRSHGNEKQQAFFQSLGNIKIHAIGSSLKFCLVAEGKVDIYPRFGPTSEWDTAAAQCIVEEAGGVVTDTSLQPIRYNNKESLLNPDFLVIADTAFDWMPFLSGL